MGRTTKDVGYFLRVYRATNNLTQGEAAKRFGVSSSYWSLMESGDRHPSKRLAPRLAKETGAPLLLLLGVEAPKR